MISELRLILMVNLKALLVLIWKQIQKDLHSLDNIQTIKQDTQSTPNSQVFYLIKEKLVLKANSSLNALLRIHVLVSQTNQEELFPGLHLAGSGLQ